MKRLKIITLCLMISALPKAFASFSDGGDQSAIKANPQCNEISQRRAYLERRVNTYKTIYNGCNELNLLEDCSEFKPILDVYLQSQQEANDEWVNLCVTKTRYFTF